jgi:cell division protein FtsQ
MFKKILTILFWILLPVSLVALMGFVQKEQQAMSFKSIEINVDYSDGNFFIDQHDVKTIIYGKGDSLIGSRCQQINLSSYERLINQNPSVQKAQIYSSVDGKLFVTVQQRKPVIRIMNTLTNGFYVDEKGKYMPLSGNYTARVIIVNGHTDIIPNDEAIKGFADGMQTLANVPQGKSMLADLYTLSTFIRNDTLWNAMFEQIYVNAESDIELIPKVGKHIIILGSIENMKRKFENLKLFYRKGLNRKGWENYEIINLKFSNQVVCIKNKNQTIKTTSI